jgi:hypothetical protein
MTTVADVMDRAIAEADEAARKAIPTDDDAVAERILQAAALQLADYERARVALARELGIRLSTLDGFVKAARRASGEEQARSTQRDELVAIGAEGDLWPDEAGATFATVERPCRDLSGHVTSAARPTLNNVIASMGSGIMPHPLLPVTGSLPAWVHSCRRRVCG